VAIKQMHAALAQDPEFAALFLQEARLAARIRHPNVVQLLDVVAEWGELFLVLDYVDGVALSQLTRKTREANARMPLEYAVSVMASALHGLHAAHEATDEHGQPLHIVHRDVSPQNVMVGRDGVARVLDFGVAKATARRGTSNAGSLKGKFGYMSPEQTQGQGVDRRADVFSAGVVLWEALTGERLFHSEDGPSATIHKLMSVEAPAPSSRRKGIPPRLDSAVLRALRKDPAERFATAQDFAIELEACCELPAARLVGAWVEQVMNEELVWRSQCVAEVERYPATEHTPASFSGVHRPVTVPTATAAAAPVVQEQVTFVEGSARIKHKRRARGWVFAAAGLGALVLLGVGFARSRQAVPPEPGSAVRAAAPVGSAATMLAVIRSSEATDAGPSALAAPAVASSSQPTPTPSVPPTTDAAAATRSAEPARAKRADVPRSRGAARARQSAANDPCANPIAIGHDGIRRYRAECL
jgi:serine/threonine-protein kinase